MRVLGWIAGVLVALVIAVVAVILLMDRDRLRGYAEEAASGMLGRSVEIGSLDVRPGWTTGIRLSDLRIANPDWASGPNLATVSELEVAIRVWPLVTGDLELPRVAARGGDIRLERDPKGRTSWDLGLLAEEATLPDERAEAPRIGRMEVVDTTVRYSDSARDLAFESRVDKGWLEGRADGIDMALTGALAGEEFRLGFSGGGLSQLTQSDSPYPARVSVRHGRTEFSADGTVRSPFSAPAVDAQMTLSGPNLERLLTTFRLPLPATPPYDLEARIVNEGKKWTVAGLTGRIGDSDVASELVIDLGGKRPAITGGIRSKELDFDDLAPLLGYPPDVGEAASPSQKKLAERQEGFFPTVRLDPEPFDAADINVEFAAENVKAPPAVPVSSIAFHVVLVDGRLRLQPVRARAADGAIEGEVFIDTRGEVPSVGVNLAFRALDLGEFFRESEFVQEMGGRFQGSVALSGTGYSLAEMMKGAQGNGTLAMRGGSMSGLVVEGIGLDISEALLLAVGEDARVPINCGRVDVVVRDGVVRIDQALMDTTDSVLVAGGTVNLRTESLDFRIKALAKDFSIVDVESPVAIGGTFTDPTFALEETDLLPFLEMGDQRNIDCDEILRWSNSSGSQEGRVGASGR